MNPISSIMNPTAAEGTHSTQRKTTLTQEDFLKLFTKQLQYQNPLSPMDNFQMATQMAQFSQVNSLDTLVKSTKILESYQASFNGLQSIGLMGKRVEAEGKTLVLEKGQVAEGYYQLAKPGKVTITISDANGKVVRVLPMGIQDVSKQTFLWDGKNQNGMIMPDGIYTFQVSATDEKNQPIQVKTSRAGTVTGVYFDQGIIYLKFGKDQITISDIISILS